MLYSKIEGTGPEAEGRTGEAKPLVILHGFLGMSDNWKTLSGQYSAEGFEVHALDLRNHGRSFHSDEFTYEAMAGDLLEYCTGHGLQTIDLLGHSMGGKVAMLFAVTYPEKVNRLIIADIAPKSYAPHHDDILAALNAVDFSKKPGRAEVEAIMKPFVPDVGTRQFLMKNLYWETPEQLAFRFNLNVFNKSKDIIGEPLPDDARFDKPVLFIRGANSRYIHDEDMELIEKHFPQARLETVANAGHWLHAENPKDFFADTIAFLKA
ncbi:MAG: alpha/beta fold hydrolase [Flavobacterium sp.]|nr:MAG: alpha/beta fold hydrolase [Flavobacterium sp.]